MFHSTRFGEFSVLARGRGLLQGGVEVECFDVPQPLSLSGKSFLAPTDSQTQRHAKPYGPRKLALPSTFVTRRGQMVLFTSPEDMIMGKSCQLHQKEVTTQRAARDLKTTSNLVDAAMNFEMEKDSGISEGDNGTQSAVLPGHFSNIYLKRLQASLGAKRDTDECTVEDIEMKDVSVDIKNRDSEDADRDSGIGQSHFGVSGQQFAMSHFSGGTVISIPDGRESRITEEGVEHPDEDWRAEEATPGGTAAKSDDLSDLKKELSYYMAKGNVQLPLGQTQKVKKKSSKSTKAKRSTPHIEKTKLAKSGENDAKPKTNQYREKGTKSKKIHSQKETTNELSKQKGGKSRKSKRSGSTLAVMPLSASVDYDTESKTELEVTAIQIGTSSPGAPAQEGRLQRKLSKAEERRLEIERKRVMKQEMEAMERAERERKVELEEKLRKLQEQNEEYVRDLEFENDRTLSETPRSEEEMMETQLDPKTFPVFQIEQPTSVPKINPLQTYKRRDLVQHPMDGTKEEKPKRVEYSKQLEEDSGRESQKHGKMIVDTKKVLENAARVREENSYRMRLEMGSHRQFQHISRSFSFSYFRYVPPKVKTDQSKGNKSRRKVKKKKQ